MSEETFRGGTRHSSGWHTRTGAAQRLLSVDPELAWTRRVIFGTWLVLYLLAALGCAEPLPIWQTLEAATFPRQVTTLITGSRGVLNQEQMLTYGTWRVAFGKEAPTATADSTCSWQIRCQVRINPLVCASQAGLETECSLHLDTLDEACILAVEHSRETLSIACPVDIIFERGRYRDTIAQRSADAH